MYFLGTTHPALATMAPYVAEKSGHGCLRMNRTRFGAGVWISFTLSYDAWMIPADESSSMLSSP